MNEKPKKPKMTFSEHCAWAKKVVDAWPEWKKNLLDVYKDESKDDKNNRS